MRHAFCLLLTVGTLLAALVPVEAACPAIPIGVTVTTVNNDRQFLVTDRAAALADTAESKELAIAEARLAARSRLRQDKSVPNIRPPMAACAPSGRMPSARPKAMFM